MEPRSAHAESKRLAGTGSSTISLEPITCGKPVFLTRCLILVDTKK